MADKACLGNHQHDPRIPLLAGAEQPVIKYNFIAGIRGLPGDLEINHVGNLLRITGGQVKQAHIHHLPGQARHHGRPLQISEPHGLQEMGPHKTFHFRHAFQDHFFDHMGTVPPGHMDQLEPLIAGFNGNHGFPKR